MANVVRTWEISVPGYGIGRWVARTRGKAISAAWHAFLICSDCSFKDFLRRAKVASVPNAPPVGDRRIGTYIRKDEPGASLRASGWRMVAETP